MQNVKHEMKRIMKAVQIAIGIITIGMTVASCEGRANVEENCWKGAGERYQIDPWLLYSIAKVESNLNPLATNININGSEDVGLMQINSSWFDELIHFGITRESLFDACTNIYVGAWVLRQSVNQYGNSWEGVGAYNAGTSTSEKAKNRRENYASRVYSQYCSGQRMRDGVC